MQVKTTIYSLFTSKFDKKKDCPYNDTDEQENILCPVGPVRSWGKIFQYMEENICIIYSFHMTYLSFDTVD
jgi:hypothetical protein